MREVSNEQWGVCLPRGVLCSSTILAMYSLQTHTYTHTHTHTHTHSSCIIYDILFP